MEEALYNKASFFMLFSVRKKIPFRLLRNVKYETKMYDILLPFKMVIEIRRIAYNTL